MFDAATLAVYLGGGPLSGTVGGSWLRRASGVALFGLAAWLLATTVPA